MCRSDGTRLSPGTYIIGADCPVCAAQFWAYHTELVLYLAEGARFWRKQRRIQAWPEQEIEINGRAALVTHFESLTSSVKLEVVSASDTAEVISVHESSR
jgi:hypothetical protein